jgi:hypothetical protein
MEYHPFRQRALRCAIGIALFILVGSTFVANAEEARNVNLEFVYHDGMAAGADYLYPMFNEAAGVFVFPIENDGWDFIDFTRIRFYHEEEAGRPFRVLLIRRDYEDEEYQLICGGSLYYETTCTDCWEEVNLYCQAELFMGSFNRCFGVFVNIVPDNDVPPLDYFSIWGDATVDHPYSSARFVYIDDDYPGYQDVPWYNSESGHGEYLIDIYATLQGTTSTGETTFSEIKLMYGDR